MPGWNKEKTLEAGYDVKLVCPSKLWILIVDSLPQRVICWVPPMRLFPTNAQNPPLCLFMSKSKLFRTLNKIYLQIFILPLILGLLKYTPYNHYARKTGFSSFVRKKNPVVALVIWVRHPDDRSQGFSLNELWLRLRVIRLSSPE